MEDEVQSLNDQLKSSQEKLQSVGDVQKELVHRMAEIHSLNNEIRKIKKTAFRYKYVKKDKNMLHFYTGINKEIVQWVFSLIKKEVKQVLKQLSLLDHLFVVLMKLKLGLYNKDLAYRFGVKPVIISRIYRQWLPVLASSLQLLIIWPDKPALRKNLPKCFKKFRNCVCIIDCSEIFIQRPLNLNARAQTWSNYKNNNTIKYLISCTPAGAVSFLSEGWGGRVSDKEITLKSGFLNLVERGDLVLADRGFTIEVELATQGATLKIPAFTKGKSQLPAADVDKSRQLANVRIHIERVIGRLRKFNILNTTIPISQVDLLDDVMVVVCGLVNLNRSVVS